MARDPDFTSWKVRQIWWQAFCWSLLIVPEVAFLAAGFTWKHSLAFGLIVGTGVLGGAFGVAEVVAPRAFLRWRAWMMRGAPPLHRQVGAAFDRVLVPDGQVSTSDRCLRMRLFGVALLVVFGIMEAAFVFLLSAVHLF